jgi:hypothetical protein
MVTAFARPQLLQARDPDLRMIFAAFGAAQPPVFPGAMAPGVAPAATDPGSAQAQPAPPPPAPGQRDARLIGRWYNESGSSLNSGDIVTFTTWIQRLWFAPDGRFVKDQTTLVDGNIKGQTPNATSSMHLLTQDKSPDEYGTWRTVAERTTAKLRQDGRTYERTYEGRLFLTYASGKTEELLYRWHEGGGSGPAVLSVVPPPGTSDGAYYKFQGK